MKIRYFAAFLIFVLIASTFVACSKKEVDYPNVTDFEIALNAGEDVAGKTVTFTVDIVIPNSAFGYNIQAGEHLNFCSDTNPRVKQGDVITVKVIEVSSMLGSYIIRYKMVK